MVRFGPGLGNIWTLMCPRYPVKMTAEDTTISQSETSILGSRDLPKPNRRRQETGAPVTGEKERLETRDSLLSHPTLSLSFPKTQQTQSEHRNRDTAIQSWVWELIKVIAHIIRSKKSFPLSIPFLVLNIENNQNICITILTFI